MFGGFFFLNKKLCGFFFKANLGDGIEYGQQRRENLGDLINETLEAFERNGGEDAFINIKYILYLTCFIIIVFFCFIDI